MRMSHFSFRGSSGKITKCFRTITSRNFSALYSFLSFSSYCLLLPENSRVLFAKIYFLRIDCFFL